MTLNIDRRVFYIVLTVVGFAAALGIGVFFGRQPGTPGSTTAVPGASGDGAPAVVGMPTVSMATAPLPLQDPTMAALPRVEIAEAFAKFTAGEALFVDARVKSEFDIGHIVGAISMPEGEAAARFGELPKDKDLILYCA